MIKVALCPMPGAASAGPTHETPIPHQSRSGLQVNQVLTERVPKAVRSAKQTRGVTGVTYDPEGYGLPVEEAPGPSDRLELDLNEGQLLALAGLRAFLGSGVSDMLERDGPFSPTASLASHALSAAVLAVQTGLPTCPYKPIGKPVSIQYLGPNYAIGFRCTHVPTAHCWDGSGTPLPSCPP